MAKPKNLQIGKFFMRFFVISGGQIPRTFLMRIFFFTFHDNDSVAYLMNPLRNRVFSSFLSRISNAPSIGDRITKIIFK